MRPMLGLQESRMMKRRIVLVCLLSCSSIMGCASVQPWQREHLASRAMQDPFVGTELSGQYAAKVVESKTAGGLAGTAPGGGCACTQ